MNYDESLVRKYALRRLATVFNVAENVLSPQAQFGRDLKASGRSDFKRNEFDLIDEDIKDVADKDTRRRLASGSLEVTTVKDYCDHMVRSSIANAKIVAQVLGLPPPE